MQGFFSLLVFVAVYVAICYCLKQICQKCGKDPGVLIWIPIVNIIPMLELAGLPSWYIVLFLIPCVNFIMGFVLWIKVSEVRGKGAIWGIITALIPIVGIPYLAFSD
jgi:hypothetical protein